MVTTVVYESDVTICDHEQPVRFEVQYYLCPTDGDVVIDTFYAEAITYDKNKWCIYEKVPMWLYELLKPWVEDYKYQLPAIAEAEYEPDSDGY